MDIIDLVCPGPDRMTAMFAVRKTVIIEYRLMSLDIDGVRQFANDQPLVDPLPVVREYAEAGLPRMQRVGAAVNPESKMAGF